MKNYAPDTEKRQLDDIKRLLKENKAQTLFL